MLAKSPDFDRTGGPPSHLRAPARFGHRGNQMPEEMGRPVKAPNNKGVSGSAIIECFLQGRTFHSGATGRFDEDLLSVGRRVTLQIQRLVPDRDSGITDIHTLAVLKMVMECKYRNRDAETLCVKCIKGDLGRVVGARNLSHKSSFMRRYRADRAGGDGGPLTLAQHSVSAQALQVQAKTTRSSIRITPGVSTTAYAPAHGKRLASPS